MTNAEVSGGLVLPYFAITIAGKGGAAGILIITFMAVTSTLSAQVIAVSSIISFDMVRRILIIFSIYIANTCLVPHLLEAQRNRRRRNPLVPLRRHLLRTLRICVLHHASLCWRRSRLDPVHARCTHMPRHLPHHFHYPLASTIESCSYRFPVARHGNRNCRLARHRLRIVRCRHHRNHRRHGTMRVGNRCKRDKSTSLFRPHHANQARKFRLGRISQRASRLRSRHHYYTQERIPLTCRSRDPSQS